MNTRSSVVAIVAAVAATAPVFAQGDHLQWSATVRAASQTNHYVVTLHGIAAEGWHVYGAQQAANGPTPLSVEIALGAPFNVEGPISGTTPVRRHDASFDLDTTFYTGTFSLEIPVRATSHVAVDVPLAVRFQVCSATVCTPPHVVHIVGRFAGA